MATIDPHLPDETTQSALWVAQRRRARFQLVFLVLFAWGTPIANATAFYLGHDRAPFLGHPQGAVGAWVLCLMNAVLVIGLSLTFVSRDDIGLRLPTNQPTAMVGWFRLQDVAMIAVLMVPALGMVRAALGLPANGLPGDRDPATDLAWSLLSGAPEEVAAAAMAVLMLRLGWSTTTIILVITGLRVWFHVWQGPFAVIPVALWAGAFAWLFLRHRCVGPLIVAHTLYGVVVWIIDTWVLGTS